MYYNRKKRSTLQNIWFNFWYKYVPPKQISYGGGPQGYYIFRKQRLINILGVIAIIAIILINFI